MIQYLVLSFLLVQGVLVCVIICYGCANSAMFIGRSDRCGYQNKSAGTGRVRVSYLRKRVGMGVMDCTRAALYFEAG